MILAIACTEAEPGGTRRQWPEPEATETGETGDEVAPVATAGELVARLIADFDTAILEISGDTGWPAPVEGGWLFVTSEAGDWSVAGDFDDWTGEAMTREDGFSWVVLDVQGAYKFTDGVDWIADPWSRAYTYDDNGEMSLLEPEEAHLERLFSVHDRTIRAWIPAGEITHTLYAQDGQNLFDPEAFWGGWHLQESAPDGMLIVGIDNTDARFDEYTHVADLLYGDWYGGEGDAYADWMRDELRPLVAATWGEAGPVGLLGSSLGGLISLHAAGRDEGEYAFAASMSGTLGWGSIGADNETMIERYAAAGHRDTAIYLDSGGSGDCFDSDGDGIEDDDPAASDNYCETLQMRDTLEAAGYEFDVDLWHWWEEDAEHNEAYWADRVWRPLEVFAAM
jgi:hypothetical protein